MDNDFPLIGIIGGVGPFAGLDFIKKIFTNTRAVKDQEHINSMLISCSSLIPDRTDFLLSDDGRENPARGIFRCAQSLYNAGARHVSVACNTAHADRIFSPFCARVKESLPGLTIVNMLETCAAFVKNELHFTRIGLLATKGTYKSAVYHEYFKKADGFELIEPEERGQDKIHEAIYSEEFGIKAYSQPVKPKSKNTLIYEMYRLAERGAEAVILGCTELPLAVSSEDFSLPVIDPGLLTARRLVSLAAPEKLAPLLFSQ
jgi:aspartate racemase